MRVKKPATLGDEKSKEGRNCDYVCETVQLTTSAKERIPTIASENGTDLNE